jgi:hypothetical protein
VTQPYNPRADWAREDKEAQQARTAIAEAAARRAARIAIVFAVGTDAEFDQFAEV